MQRATGILILFGYGIHASVHIARGTPYDVIWGCHIAALMIGIGLITGNATLNAIGLLWACFGMPIWIYDLATGGEFLPTSPLTHVGGLAAGIYGVRRMGMPRGSAWKATGAFFLLWIVSRLTTPPPANVNLAFSVHPGWERQFPSYPLYFASLAVGFGGMAFLVERLTRHLLRARD